MEFNWICKEGTQDCTCTLKDGFYLKVQMITSESWWWGLYSPETELLKSSYTEKNWCSDLESAKLTAQEAYNKVEAKK